MIGSSNDEYNIPHKFLLTNTQVLRLRKAFANNSSANIKLSQIQLDKIGQSGVLLGSLLGLLQKTGLPLMNNVLKPLAKSLLIPLELKAAASATDVAIQKNIFGSGMTTLIISNGEMNDIMKIVKSLRESGLLIKDVSKSIENEAKEQKGRFLSMLQGALGASLLGIYEQVKVQLEPAKPQLDQARIFIAAIIINMNLSLMVFI